MFNLSNVVINKIENIHTVSLSKSYTANISHRKHYGLSFCCEGEIIYSHNGNQFIQNKNCVILLPQNASYSLLCTKSGHFPLINFECTDFEADTFSVYPVHSSAYYMDAYESLTKALLLSTNHLKAMTIILDYSRYSHEEG